MMLISTNRLLVEYSIFTGTLFDGRFPRRKLGRALESGGSEYAVFVHIYNVTLGPAVEWNAVIISQQISLIGAWRQGKLDTSLIHGKY